MDNGCNATHRPRSASQLLRAKALFPFLLAALLIVHTAIARTPGFLGRQGTLIVNDSGAVALRGVNLGNWLYNESYMTGAPFEHYAWPAALNDVLGTDANVTSF